ncbi:hypothetical protein DFO61_0408 [Ectopseudomonas oleovorans]|uniref:DUF7693 domain-containing protein n=2 Tax=Ectopseudomonas oleovorans TaxID=301 RepID=A0A397NK76_ECTOL|nr:hypothetical protein DFO61_0408 [Pseudomonas oleovorans]
MKKLSDPVPMNHDTLTAREAYQVLRDIALGIRVMRRVDRSPQPNYGLMTIEVDGWVVRLYSEDEELDYCDSCHCPDGRAYAFSALQYFGTDPLELLSTWERAQLERLLMEACAPSPLPGFSPDPTRF